MKKSILLLSLALPLSLMAQSSTPSTGSTAPASTTSSSSSTHKPNQFDPNKMAEHRLKHMSEKLSLTSDQQEKIKPLLEYEAKQMQAIHENKSLTKDQKKERFRALAKSTHGQIDPILTKDQKAKLAKMHQHQFKHDKSANGTATPAAKPTTAPVAQ